LTRKGLRALVLRFPLHADADRERTTLGMLLQKGDIDCRFQSRSSSFVMELQISQGLHATVWQLRNTEGLLFGGMFGPPLID